MVYKYLGEKTVHMNRCALNAVHASITKRALLAVNVVSKATCRIQSSRGLLALCLDNNNTVAEVHHKGPAQFTQKVKNPTAPTLYPLTPLYAFDSSMDEIALEPPSAKNEVY